VEGSQNPDRLLAALARNDFAGHDEQSIREQWIYPLLGLLGYGLGTGNPVDIPFKVSLRPPVTRALGSTRWEIDYRPTVHGVGLWIIEAKRPDEDLFSDLHLSQAWGYATHSKVDVPFMMLANGLRLCVFDLTKEDWEDPIIDLQQLELPARFSELDAALGARQVAEFVRRRQLRHLRTALLAQLDEDALEQTISDVAAIVEEARPAVQANRNTVYMEAFEQGREDWDRTAREMGVWGLAQMAHSPNVVIGEDVKRCAEMVRERPPEERASALEEILEVARVGETVRPTFSLRVLRLSVALRLVAYEGADEAARAVAEEAARDGAEHFPDDPLAAAAHSFESALTAFIARVLLASAADQAVAAAEAQKRHLDVETWIREQATIGLGADSILGRMVELSFRRLWTAQDPWTTEELVKVTAQLRDAIEKIPVASNLRIGQIGNENYEMHLQFDPLEPGTRNVLADVAAPARAEAFEQHSEQARAFANDLLERYFPLGTGG
jgi:hypothetical protein